MPPTQKLPAGHRAQTLGRSTPRTRKKPGAQEKRLAGCGKVYDPMRLIYFRTHRGIKKTELFRQR